MLGAELVQLLLKQLDLGGGHGRAGFVLDGALLDGFIDGEHRPAQRLCEGVVRGFALRVEARLEHLCELRRVARDESGNAALERDVEDAEASRERPRRVLLAVRGGRQELLDEGKLDVDVGPHAQRLLQQGHRALMKLDQLLVLGFAGEKRHAHEEVDEDLLHRGRRGEVVDVRGGRGRRLVLVGLIVADVDVLDVSHVGVALLRGTREDFLLLFAPARRSLLRRLLLLLFVFIVVILGGCFAVGTLGSLGGSGVRVAAALGSSPRGLLGLRLVLLFLVVLVALALLGEFRLELLASPFPPQDQLHQLDGEDPVFRG